MAILSTLLRESCFNLVADFASTTDSFDQSMPPGMSIGGYKIISVLGEGGFGVVYLAERNQPVKRRVALKVIKPGMDSRQIVARFEAERQALAIMDHTNVAKVFGAGMTDGERSRDGHSMLLKQRTHRSPSTQLSLSLVEIGPPQA